MKPLNILMPLALIIPFFHTIAQDISEFDSLKIFYLKFKSTQIIRIDENYLSSIGDSIKNFDGLEIDSIFHDLINLCGKKGLTTMKINQDLKRDGLDLRLLLEFYKNGRKTSFGFSPSLQMFMENDVLYYKKEDLLSIKEKYKCLSLPLNGVF